MKTVNSTQLLARTVPLDRHCQINAQRHRDTSTYPVLSLPDELVSEIFVHCIPVYPLRPVPLGPDCPTHLTAICHHWRAIALSTPSLWRAIHIDLDVDCALADSVPTPPHIDRIQMFARYLEFLRIWTLRSKNCPLSIYIHHFDGDMDRNLLDPVPFIHSILPHRARWEHMSLQVPFGTLGQLEGPMPLLRELRLGLSTVPGEISPGVYANPTKVFHNAPRLEGIVLLPYSRPTAINIPWAQFTTLVAPMNDYEFLLLLRDAVNLVHCAISFTLGYGDTPNSS
ncbi:hypothetical protein C8J57DRAFT_759837 [Mycena rebaudengoi]|nr:hypothetical protein C8J57DRAFT_759837 [Mycena rebaudengoi]